MISLKKENQYAAAAHIGSFILLIILYNYFSNSQVHATAQTFRYKIPSKIPEGGTTCNSNFTVQTEIAGECVTDYVYAPPEKVITFNVIYGCLIFFMITAFAHIYYATDGFGSGSYNASIQQGWNPYRWYEYAASASIMTVLIANSLGVRDQGHLISLVFINVALQACGYLVENALIQKDINLTTVKGGTLIGWTLLLGMWIPIIYAFIKIYQDVKNLDLLDGDGNPVRIPKFVWFIIAVQIFNFCSFGFIQLWQVTSSLSGKIIPYETIERKYLLLSFAGKLALAGGLAYGLIFRTKDCVT